MGVPLGGSFADEASGWGMNFEGGYFVTPAVTVGPFISYQTNLEKIPRQTITLGSGNSLTTNQKHALFQLPFGIASRYNWLKDSIFQPYAGLKLGASYAEMSSYYYVVKQYTDTWGFYLSPEIGVSIFPDPGYRLGFHVSLYYSYATNSGVLPVFGPVAVADDEDAVGQVIGVDGGEVRPGVSGGIDQIIPVEIRCRGLFLAGAERDCRECDCRVA